jgi:F0F1-type ATP synthase assembly protein I
VFAIIFRFLLGPMTDKEQDKEIFLARSLRFMQDSLRRSGPAVVAGYTLIAAILLLGGLGYALDAWCGTSPWFLVTGLFLGLFLGFFELAKIIWRK